MHTASEIDPAVGARRYHCQKRVQACGGGWGWGAYIGRQEEVRDGSQVHGGTGGGQQEVRGSSDTVCFGVQ